MKVAIIGGGISGIMTAIKLSKNSNINIDLYEERNKILDSLPYCHLHAGGFLYPMISLLECKELLYDSLLFAEYFEKCLFKRPTIICYKSNSKFCTKKLLFKCKLLMFEYNNWITKTNKYILGKVCDYYCEYNKEDIINCKNGIKLNKNKYHDKYVEEFCKILKNIDDIKYPFVSVCEYGINQDLVEVQLHSELQYMKNINILTNLRANVNNIDNEWIINNKHYNTIINATGYQSANLLINKEHEFLETKAAWIIQSKINNHNLLPEIAIIGERNTKDGMIQITPTLNNIYQIHYMSKDSSIINCSNKINYNYVDVDDIDDRIYTSIAQIKDLFYGFDDCIKLDYKIGVQRIVDSNKDKRISNIIQKDNYIEIRLLKAISIIKLINQLLIV